MIRPRLMELVERAAKLYDLELEQRELGRQWEAKPDGDKNGTATAAFKAADRSRKQRLALLRRAGLL